MGYVACVVMVFTTGVMVTLAVGANCANTLSMLSRPIEMKRRRRKCRKYGGSWRVVGRVPVLGTLLSRIRACGWWYSLLCVLHPVRVRFGSQYPVFVSVA